MVEAAGDGVDGGGIGRGKQAGKGVGENVGGIGREGRGGPRVRDGGQDREPGPFGLQNHFVAWIPTRVADFIIARAIETILQVDRQAAGGGGGGGGRVVGRGPS